MTALLRRQKGAFLLLCVVAVASMAANSAEILASVPALAATSDSLGVHMRCGPSLRMQQLARRAQVV